MPNQKKLWHRVAKTSAILCASFSFFSCMVDEHLPAKVNSASDYHAPRKVEIQSPNSDFKILRNCMLTNGVFHYPSADGGQIEVKAMLDANEKLIETYCGNTRYYLLTDRSLIAINANESNMVREKYKLLEDYSRVNFLDFYNRGISAWAPSEDKVYVLTSDRLLSVLDPFRDSDAVVASYKMTFDCKGAKMLYRSGTVLIGTENAIVGIIMDEDAKMFMLNLNTENRHFFELSGDIYYGNRSSDAIRIKIEKGSVHFASG